MNEKIICESTMDSKASVFLKSLFLIPAVLIVVALSTGEAFDFTWFPGWLMLGGILLAIIVGFVIFALSSCKMVVTDKRVYGKATCGQQVDLPLDMISASSTGLFKSVGVSTSSGKIVFWLLENQKEIYSSISLLLLERQQKKNSEPKQENISNAEELKKYKELLDNGTISQEEFDAKKKQLLGL